VQLLKKSISAIGTDVKKKRREEKKDKLCSDFVSYTFSFALSQYLKDAR
jgi:hypothetical protein